MSSGLAKHTNTDSSPSAEETVSEQTSGESSSEAENWVKNPRKRTFNNRRLKQLVSGFDSSSDDSEREEIHFVGKCYINFLANNNLAQAKDL
jgi:hypothetical protein